VIRYEPTATIHSYRPRVVVADDQPEVIEAIRLLVESRFDVIATAVNGREAVDVVGRMNPDLLVLDVIMPDVDGFKAVGEIRTRGLRAGAVLVSGLTDSDYVLKALNGGAQGFVTKARMGMDLVPALENVLEGRTYVPSASVLPRWRRPDKPSHCLHLYDTEDGLLDMYAGFAVAALQAGDAVMLGANASRLRAIEPRVNARGFDAKALIHDGRYVPYDVDDALSACVRSGDIDAASLGEFFRPLFARACAEGDRKTGRVSIAGALAPALYEAGQTDAAIELERRAGDVFDERVTAVLCPYPVACFPPNRSEGLKAICSAHLTIAAAS
jgi:CheY-like chemotaxis protein